MNKSLANLAGEDSMVQIATLHDVFVGLVTTPVGTDEKLDNEIARGWGLQVNNLSESTEDEESVDYWIQSNR